MDSAALNSSVNNFIRDQYLNPDVNQKNIGVNSARINKDMLLGASKAVLDISKGTTEPSSRDSMEFQRVYGPAEYLAEHVLRDGGRVARDLLWKVTHKRGLDSIPSGVFNEHTDNVFNDSKLAQYIEGSSMWESLDNNTKLTRIGEGGIGDPQVAPDEMRTVQPSFMGYVDPVRSPECYDELTEVYTKNGWKLFKELKSDDELACMVEGKLEYHMPKQVVQYEYAGPMVCGKRDEYIDFCVTPEHRMLVKYHAVEYQIVEARHLFCSDKVPTQFYNENMRECFISIGLDRQYELSLFSKDIQWNMDYRGTVYCATVPGGIMYVRRNGSQGFWCGNSTRIGLDIFMAKNTKKGSDGRLYTNMLNSRTGKIEEVDSVTAAKMNIGTAEYMNPATKAEDLTDIDWEAYEPEILARLKTAGIAERQAKLMLAAKDPTVVKLALTAKNRFVPVPGGKTGVKIINRADVDYWMPNPDDSYSAGSNLVPMLSAIKGMRLLMGSKYFSIHGDEWVYVLRTDGEVYAGPVKDYIWKDGDQTYSIMSALEEEMVQVRGVTAHQTEDAMCKLHLSGGVSVRLTAGHSCVRLSKDGYKLEEIQTIDLQKGDLIPCTGAFPGYVPVYDIQTVSVPNAWLRGYCSIAGRVKKDGVVNIYTYSPAREHKVFKVLDGMMILADDLEVNGTTAGLQINSRKAKSTIAAFCGQDLDQMLKGILFGSQQSKQSFIAGLLDANLGLTTWECKGRLYAKLGFYSEEFRNMVSVIAGSCGMKTVMLETCREYCVYIDISSVRTIMLDPMPKIKQGIVPDIDVEMPDPVGSGRSVLWRRVLDVEIFGPTQETVYDLDTGNNLFLCSIGVFVHNSQSLPLINRETPFVQSLDQASGQSMENIVGNSLGVVRSEGAGIIQSITPDDMSIKYQDGTIKKYDLYNNFPANQKGYIQSYTDLKPGDMVTPGQVVSYSNYTNKQGSAAGGTNLRAAYMSYQGKNYEDGIVISDSAAKKLTSEILYKNDMEKDKSIHMGKSLYTAWGPGKFNKEQLSAIGPDGIVKPGTVLHKGDPIMLAIRENMPSPGTMGKRVFMDMAERWEHDSPGTVVDVVMGKDGPKVYTKITSPAVAGDKMCYSGDHDILTEEGWVNVKSVLPGMLAISLNPETAKIEHVPVSTLHTYEHMGPMFNIENEYFSLNVTPEHKLFANIGRGFDLYTAAIMEGSAFDMTNAGGVFSSGSIGAISDNNGHKLSIDLILLVQAFISVDNYASAKDKILVDRVKSVFASEGISYHIDTESDKLILDDRALIGFVEELDIKHTYPSFFRASGKDSLDLFIDSVLSFHGNTLKSALLDMVQAAAVYADRPYVINSDGGVTVYKNNMQMPVTPIDLTVVENSNLKVYCPELPRNHILFVRRRNKTCWCGNSGRYGNKGVIAEVVPDDRMPKGEDGRHIEVLMSPLGVLSRCYDADTEFMTQRGWIRGEDITSNDMFYIFDPQTTTCRWGEQKAPFYRSKYTGVMLGAKNTAIDFLVTPGHTMWTRMECPGTVFKTKKIDDIFGKRYYLPGAAPRSDWPTEATPFYLPTIEKRVKDTHTKNEPLSYDPSDWAAFLGWYLSEGSVTCRLCKYEVQIAQSRVANPEKWQRIDDLLRRMGLHYVYNDKNTQFHIYGKRFASYFVQFGKCADKFVPEWIFTQPKAVVEAFISAILAGDGSLCQAKNCDAIITSLSLTSLKLIEQVQRLMVLLGRRSYVRSVKTKSERYKPMWRVGVTSPWHTDYRLGKKDWYSVDYEGQVYCPTVETGFVMTRRNGKVLIAGNTNSAQNIEMPLGKIAEKTGKPYIMPSFLPDNLVDFAEKELAKYGLKDTETVYDPDSDQSVKDIQTGNMYFYRLKHTSEGKSSGRGIGGYTSEGVPASGGYSGSKRLGRMETVALAGHQAFEVLKDAKLIRGQANDEFWRSIRSGEIPVMPGEPTVYKKFFAHLKGAGIDVRKTQDSIDIAALTDSGIKELSGNREVQNSGTFDAKHYNPIAGGLFGEDIFGVKGDRFGKISLDEPMPNPIMEKPICRILGLAKKDFDAILDGEQELDGKTGGTAIKEALSKIDVKGKLQKLPSEIYAAPASRKDKLIKEYRDLYRMFKQGIRPEEYMLSAIPVIPPQFRPITTAGSLTMVADSDYLYRQLFDARNDLREAKQLSPDLEAEARKNLRRTYKELEGLIEPQAPELKNKNVSGLLKWALGSNPKMSAFSRRILGSTLDTVGRGVVIPNPKLKLNQIGIPEEQSWDIYEPFITRDLVAHGYTPVDAAEKVKNRAEVARSSLYRVADLRPVLVNRAPSLHKYSIMGFKPVIVPGHAIQVSPSIVSPFGMDFDGDTTNFHVPVSKKAIDEAYAKMLPERNLIGPRFGKIMYPPEKEYLQGLYIASRRKPTTRIPKVFGTLAELSTAYKKGKIDIDDPVIIADREK